MRDERVVERTIGEEDSGQRIDKFLAAEIADRSRAQIQELVKAGLVTVLGSIVKPSYRLATGDVVIARVPPEEEAELIPQPMPLHVVYDDDDVVVVNKPAGMVVHPAPGHQAGTLVNALLARFPEIAGLAEGEHEPTRRPGIVHRLDKQTSGLILVAKHEAARQFLQRQFKEREVQKTYIALVEGRLQPPSGIIDAPIGRHPQRRQRMAVLQRSGRPAKTVYHLIEYLNDYSLISVQPITGRTHQIRVHLAAIEHPVVGDGVYGYRRQRLGIGRQFLHAWKLALTLPSGEAREFIAPLPADLRHVLVELTGRVPEELL
ncbi:MAG: RluA family pseudouridine synthase [Anaerolineae bacterium]